MITREECAPGKVVSVNTYVSFWNTKMGTKSNGLFAFPFQEGHEFDEETKRVEIKMNTKLVLLGEPTYPTKKQKGIS